MKNKKKQVPLIRKTSQGFLIWSVILMLLSSIALYFYVRKILQQEVEEDLFSSKARVEKILQLTEVLTSIPPIIEITPVQQLGVERLKDTIIYDPSQDEMEEFRELSSYENINGKYYRITIRNLIVDTNDILFAIIFSYILIIFLVIVFQFFLNRLTNIRIWAPFLLNLEAMKKFSVSSNEPIPFIESEIIEFAELHSQISQLTKKVRNDYLNLKQYTENMSHELQTPLAIIQAKIENIINGDNLSDTQFNQLSSIQTDIQRLTQMNRRLTLLTKIENNQFLNVQSINITNLISETITNFQEISTTKIKHEWGTVCDTKMDPYLAEVLCNNLLSNAIKYSPENGLIHITTKGKILSISNMGTKALENPDKLYSRFYRESDAVKSTGLGLAIVKRICDLYNFKIDYQFESEHHIFIIHFK